MERVKQLRLQFYYKNGIQYIRAVFITNKGDFEILDTELNAREIAVFLDDDQMPEELN